MNRLHAITHLVVLAITASTGSADIPTIYVSHAGHITRLVDRNGDDDFLDAFESIRFADIPVADGLIADADQLWVFERNASRIVALRDVNGDDDALDEGEQSTFAVISAVNPPALRAIDLEATGTILCADAANDAIVRLADHNGDGDALDVGESTTLASDLPNPTALAARLDGAVLVGTENAGATVRLLHDHNADGDFLDFAESLTYAENLPSIADICVDGDERAWLTLPTSGVVLLLIDVNHDDDALDANETRPYAVNFTMPTAMARDPQTQSIYIATADAGGAIVRLRDLNGDGDALDFGEAQVVAADIEGIDDIAIPRRRISCAPGDADGDGIIDIDDIPAFARALLDADASATTCPIDMNNDGLLDSRDIQPFVIALIS